MDVTDSRAGSRQRVVGFADVVQIPLRRWRIVLAVTQTMLLAVVAYLVFFPATYRATTVVVLRPVVTDPFTLPNSGADRAINMTAENGIALGNDVIDATSHVMGRSADDVREALTVEVPTGGQVLRFEYADDTEEASIAGANVAAQTYLRVRQGIYQQQRAALLLSYDSTVKQVTEQRRAAQRGLPENGSGSGPASPRTQAMLDQVSALNDQLAQLANARAKVASADLIPGSITAAARAPVPSSRDAAVLYLIGALLGGILLGMIAAHAREALDRRIRSIDEAADLIGVPALGVVRAVGKRNEAGVAADARYVSLAVLKWIDRHPDQPLVVLSGRDGEGRSTVAGNLAVALAAAGHDVWLAAGAGTTEELKAIMFAAQHRTPPQPRAVPLSPSQTNLDARLNDSAAASRLGYATGSYITGPVAGVTRIGGSGFAPSGDGDIDTTMAVQRPVAAPTSPIIVDEYGLERRPLAVLIGSGLVRLCTLDELPGNGVVVVDAPPSDADERGVRVAQSGGAVLVVARDRTRNADLTRLVDRLRSAGAQTVGFVLTGGRNA